MCVVLIYTSPARGHLYPIMDVALELQRRGHDVRVRTLAAEVKVVRAAGLRAQPIAPAIEARAVDDWRVANPLESVKRSLQTFIDRGALEIDDLRAAVREERPDVLLLDTNAWGAQAAAETMGLPWATWHPFPLPLPSPDVPPFGPGFARARGPLGRVRDALLRPLVIGPMQKCLPALNHVRAQAGARPFSHIIELYIAPPLMLYLTAEPFEYARRDWPASIHRIGPGLWSPPASSSPAWLAASKPVVLVTCSTEYQNDGALLEAAIGSFADDATVQLVCTTAGVDPASVRAPAHVIVERFVPHALVLPKAVAVVCHGGMGITQRALAMGVPPCVVPFGRDQLEVARRVVEAGAGSLLPRGKLDAVRLRAAVARARGCTAGIAAVREGFARAGGAVRGATLVEELVALRARAAA